MSRGILISTRKRSKAPPSVTRESSDDDDEDAHDDEEIVISHELKKPKRSFSRIETLPDELLLLIFRRLQAEELIRASCVSKRWHCISGDQSLWKALCCQFGRGLLDPEIGTYVRSSTGRVFQWEKEKNWKRAYIQLANNQRYIRVQVFHRELADEFQLSWYDANLLQWNEDGSADVAYPPIGRPDSRAEKAVPRKRIRAMPYHPRMVNKNGIYHDERYTAGDFVVGMPVEVQWKAARQHCWGWWEGKVSQTSVDEQYVDVRFAQYEGRGALYEPYLWERVYLHAQNATPGTGELGVMGGIRMVASLTLSQES